MIRTAALFLFAVVMYAQTVVAPQLGLIPDGGTLRPVAGISASAAVGSPVTFSRNLTQLVVAPSQAFALAVDTSLRAVVVATPDGSTTLLASIPKPDTISFSPRGSAAILYYSSVRQALIVTNLPGNPSARDIDLTFAGADPLALAITDDGSALAGSWPGIAYRFDSNGAAGFPSASPIEALAFAPGTSDLALVSTTNAILANASGTMQLASFPSPLIPVGAALDSRRLVFAESGGRVYTIDLSSQALSKVDCQCAPEGLFTMTRSVYRLTSLAGGAFKLFDADQNTAWFAPLALSTGGAQ